MPDILHKAGIKSSSLADTYKALTTREGLSAWWTRDTHGESKVGGVLQFHFGTGGFDMKVLELHPVRRVLWQVVDGPEEWVGTMVSFDPKQEGDWTIVLFKHQGWNEPVEFMHYCSTKWGAFSAEPEVVSRIRKSCSLAERNQARQLGIKRYLPTGRNDDLPDWNA